jgi:hypothetical protein
MAGTVSAMAGSVGAVATDVTIPPGGWIVTFAGGGAVEGIAETVGNVSTIDFSAWFTSNAGMEFDDAMETVAA